MTTIGTLFSGFGGVDVGAQAAGLTLAWGVELDPAIAAVATRNLGHDVIVANLLECDPRTFAPVDVLHASPPCTNASVANANGGETALDKRMARKVAEFITVLRPRVLTLENVWGYRRFMSWQMIEEALHRAGYWVTVDHVNAADVGVPQTRKRMIVRAVLGGFVPYLPEAVPWVGWYEAIEDLLPTLPESAFAPWQLARLPELLQTTLVGQNGYEGGVITTDADRPSPTVTANHNQIGIRAFLVGDQERQIANAGTPAFTVRAGQNGGAPPRAFLLPGGGNTNFHEAHPGKGCRFEHEPSHTVPAISSEGGAMPRAWLVSGQNANANNGTPTIRDGESPAPTITNQARGYSRALLEQGRVVSMTPRALARFQSFPDDFVLPDNARLAAKGLGNAVPPLLYQRIIAPLLEAI